MVELLLRETTTLGVRYRAEQREILQRKFVTVATPFGPIKIKVGRRPDGQVMNAAPEFDDCHAAALHHQVAVREVQQAALQAYANPAK